MNRTPNPIRPVHAALALLLASGLALGACGTSEPNDQNNNSNGNNNNFLPNPPSQAQIEDAKARVRLAVAVAEHGRNALELLGLWPVYDCGGPRSTFVGQVADGFSLDHPCATVTTSADATADRVEIAFPPAGCDVEGYTLTGDATLLYSGGADRLDLEADLRTLTLDGVPLQSRVGYGACGDTDSVWVESTGTLPAYPSHTFSLDMTVTLSAGFPLFGSDSLTLNGSASLAGPAGTDSVTFNGVTFDVGEYLPKQGVVIIQTAGGTTIRVTFDSNILYGEARIKIDDHDAVTVPLL